MKKLDAAIGLYEKSSSPSPPSPPISVEWKPYIIDPNTKADGEDFEAYNVRRWGSSGWTSGLKRSGRKVGANFANWTTWPNTLKAHQLIAYVTDPERHVDSKPSTAECYAAIFDAMYERGENVSLVDTLVGIGTGRLGVTEVDAPTLRSHLQNDAGEREVTREIQGGRIMYNITSVPFFVIEAQREGKDVGRPYGFSGAQHSATFMEMFQELAAKLEKTELVKD